MNACGIYAPGPVDSTDPDTSVAEGRARGPRRRVRLMISVGAGAFVLLLVIVAVLTPDSSPTRRSDRPGRARLVPAFRLPSLRDPGSLVSLESFRGRPVVLNFWASWCVPCRKEMPAFQAVYREVHARVAFVGVDHEDARTDALTFLRTTGVRYPIAFDPDGTTARDFGMFGVPTTVFIDARGRELERHTGQLSRADLEATIERLFRPRRDRAS